MVTSNGVLPSVSIELTTLDFLKSFAVVGTSPSRALGTRVLSVVDIFLTPSSNGGQVDDTSGFMELASRGLLNSERLVSLFNNGLKCGKE